LLTLLYVHTKSHKQFNVSTKIDVKKCNNFFYLTKCVPINKEHSNIEHHIPSNTILLLMFPPVYAKLHTQHDVFTNNNL